MLITVKNNGKGAEGIYANESTKPEFVRSGGAKRFTVTESELARIRRIPTLVVIEHTGKDEDKPLAADGSNSTVLATTGYDGPEAGEQGDVVEHPVLDEGDNGGAADQPEGADKPWEKPDTGSKKKK